MSNILQFPTKMNLSEPCITNGYANTKHEIIKNLMKDTITELFNSDMFKQAFLEVIQEHDATECQRSAMTNRDWEAGREGG